MTGSLTTRIEPFMGCPVAGCSLSHQGYGQHARWAAARYELTEGRRPTPLDMRESAVRCDVCAYRVCSDRPCELVPA